MNGHPGGSPGRFFYYLASFQQVSFFNPKIMKNRYILILNLMIIFMLPTCSHRQTKHQDAHGTQDAPPAAERPGKPAKDKALLDMLSLYRARRYESVAAAIASPDTVYNLVLYGQKLGKIDPEIAELKYLNSLDMAFNELTEVPPCIKDLEYLQGLYLNGNMITRIPSFVYGYPYLSRFDISENQLTRVSPDIHKLSQLTVLNLRANKLSEFPAEIYQLKQLKSLHLDHNQLTEIPEGISSLTNLSNLRLEHNQLADLPDELGYMVQLEELWLQGNPIPLERISYLRAKLPGTRIRY
jgi:Leucine-rich repeat (LRR) protein